MSLKILEVFDFLEKDVCDEIISYARNSNIEPGILYNGHADAKSNNKLRNNRIVWYKISNRYQEWTDLMKKFHNSIDWIETPQLSFYKPGEFFEYHQDQSDKSLRTHIRCLTLTANLQVAEGAYIEVQDKKFINMRKGQAVVFPSNMLHRAVSPISGERISFTIWGMSKNFNKR
jgi:predicted 2-oxoglutarate/Fe(II)-dependent dioxygenase YbiX